MSATLGGGWTCRRCLETVRWGQTHHCPAYGRAAVAEVTFYGPPAAAVPPLGPIDHAGSQWRQLCARLGLDPNRATVDTVLTLAVAEYFRTRCGIYRADARTGAGGTASMITKASITYGGSYKMHLIVKAAVQAGGSWRMLCGTSCAVYGSRDLSKVTCKRCRTIAANQAARKEQQA